MGILEYVLLCVVLGLVVYLIRRFIPLPDAIQTLILIAVIVFLVIVLLRATGILGGLDYPIPKLR